jgi:threonine/homoserine/homoserine lactone efflux protein
MTVTLWLAYTTTLLVFMSTPGPSHLLMLSNSLSNGFRRSLATAAGDLTANVGQMTLAATGLASLIAASPKFFVVVKWAGVLFLMSIGVSQFRRRFDPGLARLPKKSRKALYMQGLVTSAANPKAIVFFAALFPQFVNAAAPASQQFLILGVTFLLVDATFLCFYGGFATWIAGRFRHHAGRHLNQISGALLVVAAIVLGLRDIKSG